MLADVLGADVLAALAALPTLEALPDEPTLVQARRVRPLVARLLAAPVGPGLLAALGALTGVDRSERESAEVTAAWERLRSHCAGGQLATLATWQESRSARVAREVAAGAPDPWRARSSAASIGDEIAPRLGVAPGTATARVTLGCRAEAEFPAAADALSEGRMTLAHLEALAGVARGASEPVRRQLEAEAVRRAPRRTAAQLRQDLVELAARLDPEHAAKAVQDGVASRNVWLRPSPTPGCARLQADLPLQDAAAVMLALGATVAAAKAGGDERTVGQLRADALTGSVTGLVRDLLSEAMTRGAAVPVPTRDDLARLFEMQVVVPDSDPGPGPGDSDPGPGPGDSDPGPGPGDSDPGPGPGDSDPDPGPGDSDPDPGPGGDDPDPGPGGDDPGAGGVGPDAEGPWGPQGTGAAGAGSGGEPRDAGDHAGTGPSPRRDDPLAGWVPPAPVPLPDHLASACRAPVVVGYSTLIGRDEHPASLPGFGPLDSATARRIASGARYRWLHVDEVTGYLVHRQGRTHPPPGPGQGWSSPDPPAPPPLPDEISSAIRSPGYVPGSLLRAHVQVRDATCIGPACHHPAAGGDLDHTINYGQSRGGRVGVTEAPNLGVGCRRVHQTKTHGGWTLTQPVPGRFVWTSPLGTTHTRAQRPVLPGWDLLHPGEGAGAGAGGDCPGGDCPGGDGAGAGAAGHGTADGPGWADA